MKQTLLSFVKKAAAPMREIDVVELSSSSDDDDEVERKTGISTSAPSRLDHGKAKASLSPSKRVGSPLQADKGKRRLNNASLHGLSTGNPTTPRPSTPSRPTEQPQSICHHHKGVMSSNALLRCTVLNAESVRCEKRYCTDCLERIYNQSIAHILLRGKSKDQDGLEHAFEYDYVWTCPSCKRRCQCVPCSTPADDIHEKNGQGQSSSNNAKKESKQSANARKHKDGIGAQRPDAKQPSIVQSFARIINSMSFAPNISNSVSSSSTSAPPPQSAFHLPQISLPKPYYSTKNLTAPKPVGKPTLIRLPTRLPHANIIERIWLYESIIRFDAFNIPKRSVLQKLDRFDDWTEAQLHAILTRLACSLAEIKTVEQNPTPRNRTLVPLIRALRAAGSNVQSGHPWSLAEDLCARKDVLISHLHNVELRPEQISTSADTSFVRSKNKSQAQAKDNETLLSGRATRTRRAASTAASTKVRSMTQRDMRRESSEDDGALTSRWGNAKKTSRRAQVKRRIVNDSSDEDGASDESGEDAEELHGKQHSLRRSSRNVSKNVSSVMTERQAAGIGGAEVANSSGSVDDNESDSSDVKVMELFEPAPIPTFEKRIAILNGLIVLLLQTPGVAKELEDGINEIKERKRSDKEDERIILARQAEQMREVMAKRMDMHRVGKGKEWKEEYDELVDEHAYKWIDEHVGTHVYCEARKIRSGPLGRDVDGNEYWQLSEYNEVMPDDPTGHWSWFLLVIGTASSVPHCPADTDTIRQGADKEDQREKPTKDTSDTDTIDDNGKDKDKKLVYGVNAVSEIKKLIAFVRYRADAMEYEELVADRAKEGEVTQGLHAIHSAVSSLRAAIDVQSEFRRSEEDLQKMLRLRAARTEERALLQSTQEVRRAEVKTLLKRLTTTQEYYEWHEANRET